MVLCKFSWSPGPGILGYGGGNCGTSWFMGMNEWGIGSSYTLTCHCNVNTLVYPYTISPVNEWHQFVCSTDSTGTKMYIDGILDASNTTYINNTYVTNTFLGIGAISPLLQVGLFHIQIVI